MKFTKPGLVGHIYSSIEIRKTNENQEIEFYFGSKRKISLTEEEIELKEKSYSIYLEKTIEKQRISQDEIDKIVRRLKLILNSSENEDDDDRSSVESYSANDERTSKIKILQILSLLFE